MKRKRKGVEEDEGGGKKARRNNATMGPMVKIVYNKKPVTAKNDKFIINKPENKKEVGRGV